MYSEPWEHRAGVTDSVCKAREDFAEAGPLDWLVKADGGFPRQPGWKDHPG